MVNNKLLQKLTKIPDSKGENLKKIITLKENQVFSNKYGNLFNNDVLGRLGNEATYLRWQWNNPGVVIIPVYQNKIGIIRMFRYPINSFSFEFPRGGKETSDKSLKSAAKRELLEEMGLLAKDLVKIGNIYADTGLIKNKLTIFFAKITEPKQNGQEIECMESIANKISWYSPEELRKLICDNKIVCSITISAFMKFSLWEKGD